MAVEKVTDGIIMSRDLTIRDNRAAGVSHFLSSDIQKDSQGKKVD